MQKSVEVKTEKSFLFFKAKIIIIYQCPLHITMVWERTTFVRNYVPYTLPRRQKQLYTIPLLGIPFLKEMDVVLVEISTHIYGMEPIIVIRNGSSLTSHIIIRFHKNL